jgi:hypothetical protein
MAFESPEMLRISGEEDRAGAPAARVPNWRLSKGAASIKVIGGAASRA